MNRLQWMQIWQRRNTTRWVWIESIATTLIVLQLCYMSNPANPFYINAIFPWPLFAAMIIALQYGFGPGTLSILIIAIALAKFTSIAALSTPPYQTYLLTCILLTFIFALYSSSWAQKILRAEEWSAYTERRLDILSRSYNVLRVSYNYLEQSLVTKPVTMREIEEQLRKSLLQSGGHIDTMNATRFLQIVSQYCLLRVASIHLYNGRKFDIDPIAHIGTKELLNNNDPLIKYVLDNNEKVYVTLNDMADPSQSGYIAVVPIYTSHENLIGILVINEMSFWHLNNETLQVLQIFVLYFADQMSLVQDTSDSLATYPDCPPDFLKELDRLIYLHKSLKFESAIVAVRVDKSSQQENIVYSINKLQRGLDYVWHRHFDDADILLTLMPFTNAVGINGYFSRVNASLLESYGKSLSELGITERSILLYDQKPDFILHEFMKDLTEDKMNG